MDVALDVSSRSQPGQTIDIGKHTFTTMSIEILDTDVGYRPSYRGISPVGFAELDIAGAKVDEVVHLPDRSADRGRARRRSTTRSTS